MSENQNIDSLDDRLINITRFFLALSALIIIYVDPSEPDRLVNITYATLGLYTVYSGIICVLSLRHRTALQGMSLHWIDVVWYLILISLSSGTNSLFFFFFFFVILAASFRSGYKAGLGVTVASSILFVTVGYLTTPTPIEPNRFLLRSIYLASIGYLMAHWGGSEIMHKRRLSFLKDVSRLSNPRFGVDQTIGSILNKLRNFYDGDSCLLINRAANEAIIRRVDRRNVALTTKAQQVGTEGESLLLAWPPELAVICHIKSGKWHLKKTSCSIHDFVSGDRLKAVDETYVWVADMLDTNSFLSVPVFERDQFTGRLYLTAKHKTFAYSDAEFLRQVMDQVIPMIDNVRLVDRLASEASDYERQRISRDIHDSAIQPYIGLKLGLDALRRRVTSNDPLFSDIEQLVEKTSSVIKDLRGFVGGLQERGSGTPVNVLISSVQKEAVNFGEFYDIDVDVKVSSDITLNERLAAEIFQMVREGLSNIKRHTTSTTARISMTSRNGDMVLDIENESSDRQMTNTFTPRSISERATALGGYVLVNVTDDKRTVVSVTIPM